MKTLYVECKMGLAGDMLMSALFELLDEISKNDFLHTMNSLWPDVLHVEVEKSTKSGIAGSQLHISVNSIEEVASHVHSTDHQHYNYLSILDKLQKLSIDSKIIDQACQIYKEIAMAESKVHNTTIDNIHFHEVGSLDAMADVIGNCILFNMLAVDQIICSPIHVGNGTVKCAHGILPVPAPATSELLKGIPYYTGNIMSELCTPTGAAIIKYFANDFSNMPEMIIENTGIGLGHKDFELANIVRVFLGHRNDQNELSDLIYELSCNLDDITGEQLGYAMEILMRNDALDVFYIPIQMKKNRPGILLKVFCKADEINKFRDLIFKHTSTRGIRYTSYNRFKLDASFYDLESPYGNLKVKKNTGYGFCKEKIEFDSLRKIAYENDLSIDQIKKGF